FTPPPPPRSTLFPYTTLFRSARPDDLEAGLVILLYLRPSSWSLPLFVHVLGATVLFGATLAVTVLVLVGRRQRQNAALLSRLARSEEHTSELQSRGHLVCRLL